MLIHNVRLGFATNSSSTHSIVLLPPGLKLHGNSDDVTSYSDRPDERESYEFGWSNFVLSMPEEKGAYLQLLLRQQLLKQINNNDYVDAVLSGLYGFSRLYNGCVDHQSVFTFPVGFHDRYDGKTNKIDRQFFADFYNYIVENPRIAILGGNDNNDTNNYVLDIEGVKELGSLEFLDAARGGSAGEDVVCRYDDVYKYWTLFNRANGTKLRMSFDNNDVQPTDKVIDRASKPELIDLKITSYCDRGCPFCYQSSTKDGKHMDLHSNMYSVISQFVKTNQVFEVAIGGGEPTSHPDFVGILEGFVYNGVTSSFSTGSLKWLSEFKQPVVEKILKHTGAIAVSVTSVKDVIDAGKYLQSFWHTEVGQAFIDARKFTWHIPLGTMTRKQFKDVIKRIHGIRPYPTITLLGFKHIGRGAGIKVKKYDWWLDVIKELRAERIYLFVGIDTCIAAEFKDQIAAARIDDVFVTHKEGAFSMYIDGVACTAAASSYTCENIIELESGKCKNWNRQVIDEDCELLLKSFQSGFVNV